MVNIIQCASLGPGASSGAKSCRAGRHVLRDVDVVDARGRRAVAHRTLESIHRVGIAFGGDFDAAVGQVAHPPVDPFAHRRRFREEPESDALHAAADDISTRDAHLRIDPQVGRAFQASLRREPPRSAESLALPVQPRATGTASRYRYSLALPVQPRATGTAPRYRYSPALQLWLRGGRFLLHLERFRFHRIQLLPLQQL